MAKVKEGYELRCDPTKMEPGEGPMMATGNLAVKAYESDKATANLVIAAKKTGNIEVCSAVSNHLDATAAAAKLILLDPSMRVSRQALLNSPEAPPPKAKIASGIFRKQA
jgi:hypothetical protein